MHRDYPATFDVHGNALQLHYRFDATAPDDGVTLDVPLPLLRALDAQRLEWLIPGWLREKVIALLRGLPKEVRREIVPIPDAADRLLAVLPEFGSGSLFAHVAAFATQQAGIRVEPAQVAAIPLPPWLSVNCGSRWRRRVCAVSRDLAPCGTSCGRKPVASTFVESATECLGTGRRPHLGFRHLACRGDGEQRPTAAACVSRHAGRRGQRAPAPVHDRRRGTAASRAGIIRLAALALPQQHELARRQWSADREFTLLLAAAGFGKEMLGEIADRAIADAVLGADELPRTRAQFEALVERGRADVVDRAARSPAA